MSDYSELKLLTQCVGALLIVQRREPGRVLDQEELCAVKQFTLEANPVTMLRLIEDIESLKADNESLRKDAERYRWLRGQGFTVPAVMWVTTVKGGIPIVYEDLDEAIDAAFGMGDA